MLMGINAQVSGARITENRLRYLGSVPPNPVGIYTDDDVVTHNNVSKYYTGVYSVYAFEPTIERNDLIGNNVRVRCQHCKARIANNTIMRGINGMEIFGGDAAPLIENNTMSMGPSGSTGIDVQGGKPDIVRNTISGAKWGINVAGGAPSIRDRNRVENNTVTGLGYGLYVTSTSPFNVTDNNSFSNNSKAGIYLGTNANVRISGDNVISRNTQYGIRIQGGNATVEDGNSVDHSQYGVYMDTSYAPSVRDNNTINNNSVAGIYLSASVGTFNGQIWWNDIRDNAVGMQAQNPASGVYFRAECNWWDGTSETPPYNLGPYDPSPLPPSQNLYGTGQSVSDYFYYRSWLIGPSDNPTSTCTGT